MSCWDARFTLPPLGAFLALLNYLTALQTPFYNGLLYVLNLYAIPFYAIHDIAFPHPPPTVPPLSGGGRAVPITVGAHLPFYLLPPERLSSIIMWRLFHLFVKYGVTTWRK